MALKETPKKEDLLALLSGVVGANSSQDPVPLPIATGMAGTPPPVYAETTRTPADTSYGTPVVPAVIEQPLMNFGATGSMKAVTSDIRRQQKELENNVADQQDYLQAMKGQKSSRDISPTVAYLSSVAGMDPTAAKTLASAAKGQTPEDMRAELQKALAGAVEGRNKLNDNQINLLKALESDKTSSNVLKMSNQENAINSKLYNSAIKAYALGDKSKRTALGQAIDTINSGNKVATLIDSNGFNMNPQFVKETYLSLGRMLGGTNMTQQQVEDITPHFRGMDQAQALQYINNHPELADSEEFIKNAAHTVYRETQAAQQTAANLLAISKAAHDPLLQTKWAAPYQGMINQLETQLGRPLKYKEVVDLKKMAEQSESGKTSVKSFEDWKKENGR